ncbi:MAG TPA: hypothetical protein VEZ11_08455 [Thermoanaerobaculia bacterium]|nr:hypothetical protein [Thermoanaerobaculia bacterium]
MTPPILSLAGIVALFAIAPFVVFAPALRRRWLAFDAASWALAAGAWALHLVLHVGTSAPQSPDPAAPLGLLEIDPYIAITTLAVVKLAAFSLFLGFAPSHAVRWSAARAAILAALVYLLMVPAMMRTPIDGDEPYYLLITESLVHDHDLDLANQYRDLAHSATGRPDLAAQPGDPTGPHGEQYSRHEPFLPTLLVPGYLIGGLAGALATMALFGALLVRSLVRWLEDEGISEATVRMLLPLFAFGPPVVFYAARIWPEVPAALFLVEALRGVRQRRMPRGIAALLGLVLLKLRFVLIGIGIAAAGVKAWRRRGRGTREEGRGTRRGSESVKRSPDDRQDSIPPATDAPFAFSRPSSLVPRPFLAPLLLISAILLIPMIIVFFVSGSAMNVHSWRELLPGRAAAYPIGLFGLLLDGSSGLLFQAPVYLLGVLALSRWRTMPEGFRLGMLSAAIYLAFLVPRTEWHGGWSPPLRYVVVLMPILALGAAGLMDEWSARGAASRAAPLIAAISLWTVGLVAHGASMPWRLFHIASGESPLGEKLSAMWHTDFSRLIPSFMRINHAAIASAVITVLLFAAFALFRERMLPAASLTIPALALLAAWALVAGQQPGDVIELEDAHVIHRGGALYPEEYTVARFAYRGGWILRQGDSVSFLARDGGFTIEYQTPEGAMVELAGQALPLPATGNAYSRARVIIAKKGRVELKCLSGSVNLDRIVHE